MTSISHSRTTRTYLGNSGCFYLPSCVILDEVWKKFQVDQHAKTPSHMAKVQKMKSSGKQITLKMSVEKSVEKGGQAIFNDDLSGTNFS